MSWLWSSLTTGANTTSGTAAIITTGLAISCSIICVIIALLDENHDEKRHSPRYRARHDIRPVTITGAAATDAADPSRNQFKGMYAHIYTLPYSNFRAFLNQIPTTIYIYLYSGNAWWELCW